MSTWLVTGGAGFIGSALVRALLACDRVVTLDRLTYAGHLCSLDEVLSHPGHTFVQGDIADRELVLELLQAHRPAGVLHLAAETHVDRSIDAPSRFVQTNVQGTAELLAACLEHWATLPPAERAAWRLLHVSTDEVFGPQAPGERAHEDSAYRPSSPYAASKAGGDLLARAYARTYGLPVIVAWPCNTYGPRQFPEKLIPLMTLRAAAGRALPVYGSGLQVRDWLHVDDAAAALVALAQRGAPGRGYCVGAGQARSNLEVVQAIAGAVQAALGQEHPAPLEHVVDRPGHDARYAMDSGPLRRELGWAPRVPLEQGLPQTVRWFLEHPGWVEAVSGGYRGERLGAGPLALQAAGARGVG